MSRLLRLLPDISQSVGAAQNYSLFCDSLLRLAASPRVLVVGGSILGLGMEELASEKRIELVAGCIDGPAYGDCLRFTRFAF